MELLMVILKRIELVDDIMQKLAEFGVRGGTIIDGTGMAKSLVNMNDLPMFGMLRYIISDEEKLKSKILLFALKEEQVKEVKDKIKEVIGDLSEPNTGIMFTIPIKNAEGFGE
ncbi:P-II family nitrogen regulator [Sedimentibacter sp.]|uniref:P-II family nitrogen regulator n=2 Tax=Sedimentibacter sp. TaxID=1960295 RepID=UPI0028AAD4D8|nr:hypothetical protein [Sedimentibacter sp.]